MRVLVGYDGSQCADAALEDLRRAGLPDTGEMIVLSVAEAWPGLVDAPIGGVRPGLDDWMIPAMKGAREIHERELASARVLADTAAGRLRGSFPDWQISAEAVADPPHWGVVKKADAWRPDLVVVGSHGRSALGRLILGSVSHAVLTHVHTSVRVGRCGPGAGRESVRLVVGVDGSAGSAATVDAVRKRVWPAGSEVRVIAVVDVRLLTMGGEYSTIQAPSLGAQECGPIWERQIADGAADQLRGCGLAITPLVLAGDPRQVLIKEAAQWDADCIFVGAKGLSRLERFLLGSVSSAVAAQATCSVEVIR